MIISKRIISVFLFALFLLLPGCTSEVRPASEVPAVEPTPEVSTVELTLRVAAISDSGSLLLADMNSNAVYRNTLPDGKTCPVGTLLSVTCADSILEIYPEQLAEIHSVAEIEDGFDDRCALYMQVLEDLWSEDQALQADTQYVGIDLSGTSLTESEQAAIAWRFGELKQKEPLNAGFDALCRDGFIDQENLYWEDGCLLSITETESTDDSVVFDAEKWRSGLGAIFFTDCTAEQNASGHWSEYKAGGFAIS